MNFQELDLSVFETEFDPHKRGQQCIRTLNKVGANDHPNSDKKLSAHKTPAELAKGLNLYQSSVSRSLVQLQEQKLVECVTPKQYNYRHYQLSQKGKRILKSF